MANIYHNNMLIVHLLQLIYRYIIMHLAIHIVHLHYDTFFLCHEYNKQAPIVTMDMTVVIRSTIYNKVHYYITYFLCNSL